MKDIANFEQFRAYCESVAKSIDTQIKVHESPQYGWSCIAFQTDNFGGCYCNFHYDHETNEVVNWYGEKDSQQINTCRDLAELVKKELDRTLNARNLYHISELINDEY